ncbi:MAG: sigma-54-dependent Fis family transcriptional regulator [Flavobacteriia bacterium]|nr:sigma-54-dependent Fis family transcriptional regulator [Flavobacteriia bacterium]
MKTLLSWIANTNDFEAGKVLETGPTANYHKYFFKSDRHLLLSSAQGDDTRSELLVNYLKRTYPERTIELRYMGILDPIDHREIQGKINPFLIELREDQLDVFVSPGSPAMQVVWYLSHLSLNLKTTLYQMREAKHTKAKEKPELIKIAFEKSSLPVTAMYHQEEIQKNTGEDYFITPTIKKIYENAAKVAQVDGVTVLILGKSGTGKENLAKYIHKNSIRNEQAYVTVNCSAFSDSLLESRLFGYKKGAFTGADKDTQGLFELADKGTIFLDEIGDISPYMQQVLLRTLQEKEIMPLGGKAKRVNVRVIAATNQNLLKLCEEGRFRWDLYYRLSVVELDLPTLSERGKADIKGMIDHFLTQKKKELHRPKKLQLDKAALEILLNYSYPGNVRQLENIISRLYVFNEETVSADVLPKRLKQRPSDQPMKMEYIEKEHMIRVLKHFKGNKRQTALAIGWSINTLAAKMEKYGITTEG